MDPKHAVMEAKHAVAIIVHYLRSGQADLPDPVREAATVYADACASVNSWLVMCDYLIRVNMRSEALRQAQLAPDLVEQHNSLDFPDRAKWAERAAREGVAVPQPLHTPLAQRLDTAYAHELKVANELREHRRLALSRSDLRQRLNVLRLLARAEPTNLSWAEDIRAYDLARFEEIRRILDDPDQCDDWTVIAGLADELAGQWSCPVPLDVYAEVQNEHARLRREQGAKVLGQLNPELLQALDANDRLRIGDLARRVRKAVETYDVRNTALLGPLKRAEKWIKDRTAFDKLVEEFRLALYHLEWWYARRCYRRLRSYDEFEIPESLVEEYEARARVRAVVWWLVVAVVLITAAVVGCYYLLESQS